MRTVWFPRPMTKCIERGRAATRARKAAKAKEEEEKGGSFLAGEALRE